MTRAPVLGGGGPGAVACEVGLVADLEQGDVRPVDADLVVGTRCRPTVLECAGSFRFVTMLADSPGTWTMVTTLAAGHAQ